MGIVLLSIVVCGTLVVIASGIWVAFALGRAISADRKKSIPIEEATDDS